MQIEAAAAAAAVVAVAVAVETAVHRKAHFEEEVPDCVTNQDEDVAIDQQEVVKTD